MSRAGSRASRTMTWRFWLSGSQCRPPRLRRGWLARLSARARLWRDVVLDLVEGLAGPLVRDFDKDDFLVDVYHVFFFGSRRRSGVVGDLLPSNLTGGGVKSCFPSSLRQAGEGPPARKRLFLGCLGRYP